ncbi:MAG: S-layer homology domain-containing protein, partial [Oscillospiraceae bacterium]|nr:S-layer homology domain-containing protein [Oscillospiraceae bacterium]
MCRDANEKQTRYHWIDYDAISDKIVSKAADICNRHYGNFKGALHIFLRLFVKTARGAYQKAALSRCSIEKCIFSLYFANKCAIIRKKCLTAQDYKKEDGSMKKRIASTLLALALVLSLFPLFAVTAQADEEGYPYHIWIAGTWITNENKDDVLGDGTVSYDPDSATLTLNNANIVGQAYDKNYSYGIHIENWNQYEQIYGKSLSDITIELIGDNRVESPYHEFNTYGISSGRQITFRGPGSLTVKSGTGMYGDSYAIEALNKVVIESGSIHATGGAANRMRGGINGYFGVAIHGGQVITDVETPTDSHNYGIWTWKGNIVIDGGVVRVGAGLPGGTGESPSMAFSKEPILSAYPETPAVKLGSDRSGSDASDWDGTSPLSDANVQYVSIAPSSQSKPNPFEDVSEADYCFGPVLWAYYAQPQITNGMDATHFGPEQTVTRGQCVTFLWRAMGCPEPKSTLNPFEDIKADEYWYKPVLWAVEQGITKGTDATHFSPYSTLSTQHMITFLYRTKNHGEDGWDGEAATWSYDSNHLPFGVNLSVNNTTDCPRGAVVTFLYRCLESGSFIDELTVSAAIEDRTDKSL